MNYKTKDMLIRCILIFVCFLFYLQPEKVWARTVGDMRPEEDEGYFYSYAHFDIHHEMLSVSALWLPRLKIVK